MKISFICTGNASRSPFAEVVLRKMLSARRLNDCEVVSFGTKNLHNEPRNPEMINAAKFFGYELGGNTCYISQEGISGCDLIIVMSIEHIPVVSRLLPKERNVTIVLFNEYCFGEKTDVPDPYCQSDKSAYRQVADHIILGCKNIIRRLESDFYIER